MVVSHFCLLRSNTFTILFFGPSSSFLHTNLISPLAHLPPPWPAFELSSFLLQTNMLHLIKTSFVLIPLSHGVTCPLSWNKWNYSSHASMFPRRPPSAQPPGDKMFTRPAANHDCRRWIMQRRMFTFSHHTNVHISSLFHLQQFPMDEMLRRIWEKFQRDFNKCKSTHRQNTHTHLDG